MNTQTWQVTMNKNAKRTLQADVVEDNLTALVESVNNKSLKIQGYVITERYENERRWVQETGTETKFRYRMFLEIQFTHATDRPSKQILSQILRTLDTRGKNPGYGRWELSEVDGEAYEVADDENVSGNANELVGYTEVKIPADWGAHFEHLYGLESHIERVRLALDAGITSYYRNRFHCALIGPPGCGKSDICETLIEMLGEDAVMRFDGTSTTAAGAIKELSETEILPRIVVIEEIEKAPEASMQFLLGILDMRAEIRKVTARKNIQRDTKLIAIATVNDLALFRKLQSGALASRFMNQIHFKRPSRETLALILTREVRKIDGDPAWIGPTLDFCDEHSIDDPRNVIAICLCGRDALLDGSYQKMLLETSEEYSK